MKRGIHWWLGGALLLAHALPALALEQLCTDSPENPTAVLALVGAAVAGYPYLRGRWRGRQKSTDATTR